MVLLQTRHGQSSSSETIRSEMIARSSSREYVPLNSLTITKLYQEEKNSESEKEDPQEQEKLWWTDLQEQREIFRKKKNKLKHQLQKRKNQQNTKEVPKPKFSGA